MCLLFDDINYFKIMFKLHATNLDFSYSDNKWLTLAVILTENAIFRESGQL